MKYVYVVISDNDDIYLKQAAVSIMSLLYHQANAEIILLTDHATIENNAKHMDFFVNRSVKIREVDIPDKYSGGVRSRFIKSNLYEYINDDFLFIDSDTIVCSPLTDISESKALLGAVPDMHFTIDESPAKNFFCENADKLGYHMGWNNLHFNSGVLYVHRCTETKAFFQTWHKLWLESMEKGVFYDQTSFNEANFRAEGLITELDGIWNCQLQQSSNSLCYLYNAKILHYIYSFTCDSPYDLVLLKLLEKWDWNADNDEIWEIIHSPKTAFLSVTGYITSIEDDIIYKSFAYHGLRRFYNKHQRGFVDIDATFWKSYNKLKKLKKNRAKIIE